MAGYDGRGARFDIIAVTGSDLSFAVTAVDSAAAAVDLSAATITATVYNGAGAEIDTLTAGVSGAGSNVVTLSFTDSEVDALVSPRSWALVVARSSVSRVWLAGSFRVVGADRARTQMSGAAVVATIDKNVEAAVTVSDVSVTFVGDVDGGNASSVYSEVIDGGGA